MRYLGCKTTLINHIHDLFKEKGLLHEGWTLFDAFCGTGAVANNFRNTLNIVINDNLLCAAVYAGGRLFAERCSFAQLGFNPFDYFNNNKETREGFFSRNYAPRLSRRMYFTDFNARRIDYFRQQIQSWKEEKKINQGEYLFLLSSLQESVSRVANVAGVYGAYLKKWDSRSIKPIVFMPPADTEVILKRQNFCPDISIRNENIEDIIEDVSCDILYLDPPYTKNSYSVQYHILETLVRDDCPQLKGVTGARPYENISNNWSKPNKAHVLFDKVISKTKASHIVFSYSCDGIMSKDFIMSVMKRYCYDKSVTCDEIEYKRYNNFKTTNVKGHREYLFYGHKKPSNEVNYYCPLNYMGGKSPIIDFIKPNLVGRTYFVDLMGGGFNVGINATGFKHIIYNDINFAVVKLLRMFRDKDTAELLTFIERTIKKYGLEKKNKDSYNKIRTDYNQVYRGKSDEYKYLFIVILYGFQQQLRFNSQYEFNNPVGESGFSESVREKIISFSRRIKELDVDFHIGDYECISHLIDHDSLVYVDPPYLITLGSYNDGKRGFKGWNEKEELRLLNFLNSLIEKGCKIVLSNIFEHKGRTNDYLKQWTKRKRLTVQSTTYRGRNEVLIISQ